MKVKIKRPLSYFGFYLGNIFKAIGLGRWWKSFRDSDGMVSAWFFQVLDKLYGWYLDRTVKVKVDTFDTWNLDNTLAHVIHPALVRFRQLSDERYGCMLTYDEDVPEYLKDLRLGCEKDGFTTDDNVSYHKLREYWVLDEMIFAFGEISNGTENEPDITLGNDAYVAYHERINNGLLLFAKYYRSLWD